MSEIESRPGVTRARMSIETSDGKAVYFECRDPAKTVLELGYGLDAFPPMDAALAVGLARSWPGPGSSAELRIERGHGPFGIEIRAESGEIPPELAARALRAFSGEITLETGVVLGELRPYLARIAGKW